MTTPFCVMTWNVENLFPPGYQMSRTKTVTEADFTQKLDFLNDIVRQVAPDVLALQEIGGRDAADRAAFDALRARLVDGLPHHALSKHPDRRPPGTSGIRVGFLSRFEIHASDDFVDFAPGELASVPNWDGADPVTRLGRGGLRIDVEPIPGATIRLVNVHLKSKLITYPSASGWARFSPRNEDERARGAGLGLLRRAAEAVAARFYLNQFLRRDETAHVILLGDLNDEPRAATTQLLLGPVDNDATVGDQGDPLRLYNLGDGIPLKGDATHEFLSAKERYSRKYGGRGELIDHILVSRGLLGTPEKVRQGKWVVQEVRSLVDTIEKETLTEDPVERVGRARPDHAPVYARFNL